MIAPINHPEPPANPPEQQTLATVTETVAAFIAVLDDMTNDRLAASLEAAKQGKPCPNRFWLDADDEGDGENVFASIRVLLPVYACEVATERDCALLLLQELGQVEKHIREKFGL